MTPKQALLIASIAHGAKGQTRASGAPYITHPKRAALLTRWFSRLYFREILTQMVWDYGGRCGSEDLIVAAYLHDVLEDTKLTRDDLLAAGITYLQLDIVERLTKPEDGPAPQSYYQRISEHTGALVVKAADRCSNLEDALAELFVPVEVREVRRWAKYVDKTYTDVLPMYVTLPGLRSEIEWRLKRIAARLPSAKAERQSHIARKRAEMSEFEYQSELFALTVLGLDVPADWERMRAKERAVA